MAGTVIPSAGVINVFGHSAGSLAAKRLVGASLSAGIVCAVGPEIRVRADALEWREVEGAVIALDLHTSEYIELNSTAAMLWPDLTRGTTRDDLVARLVQRSGIDEPTAARDADAFVRMLDERGLVEHP